MGVSLVQRRCRFAEWFRHAFPLRAFHQLAEKRRTMTTTHTCAFDAYLIDLCEIGAARDSGDCELVATIIEEEHDEVEALSPVISRALLIKSLTELIDGGALAEQPAAHYVYAFALLCRHLGEPVSPHDMTDDLLDQPRNAAALDLPTCAASPEINLVPSPNSSGRSIITISRTSVMAGAR